MIEKTISEIEAKIGGAESVSAERKQELLQLLGTLEDRSRRACQNARRTGQQHRESIRQTFRARGHARKTKSASRCEHSLQGLRSSVEGFEQSHPKLVQIVNSISNTLSNLGI